MQNRFRQEANVSVSGATDKTDYFISAELPGDPLYIQGSSFNRYNVRSNINSQITKWLKAGINMAYSRRAVQSPATRYGRNLGSAVANVFRWVNGQSALIPLFQRNADGSYIPDAAGNKQYTSAAEQNGSVVGPTGGPTSTANLDYILNHDKDETISNDINIRGYVEAKFLKDFTFQANLRLTRPLRCAASCWNPVTGSAVSTGGAWGQNYNEYNNINTQQTLNWAHDYGKHHVDAMIGHEFNWNRGYSLNYKTQSSIIPDFQAFTNFLALNGGATFSGIGGGIDEEALEGYFMRANYNYDNKYYVTASVRTDGSSKFRYNDTRWGTFWSVGGAWRLSGESWLADATWLTDLKLRADYGIMGNQNGVDRYSGYQTWSYGANGYTYSGTNVVPANITLGLGNYVNSGLTWEKKKTFDIGLDFRLWDRFYGTIDYYNITVDDMIWAQPIAISLGQPSIDRNNAKMRNQGIEIELGVDIIKTPDILWSFSVNGTHYTNKIIGVPEGIGTEALNGGWTAGVDAWSKGGGGAVGNIVYLRGKGKDLYNMYLFKYGGVDQATGLPLFASTVSSSNIDKLQKASHVYGDIKEGNVVYTTDYSLATRQEFGSATPKFIGGFSTSFRWKDLDFAATFAFQCGGKFFSNEYALNLYNNQKLAGALSAEMKGNTWTPDNTGAKFPMQMYGTTYTNGAEIGSWMYTDMSLFSASYLNVKNLTLGYNLPQKWMDKIGIGGITRLRFGRQRGGCGPSMPASTRACRWSAVTK
ncbi:MAG: SusC/RagA family TonB-linked outer membrane protein [Alistipes indistinctus]